MTTRITTLIHTSTLGILRLALLGSLATAGPLLATSAAADSNSGPAHGDHGQKPPATLVQLVRNATRQFIDVNNASSAGYGPFLGCISGPDHGAMGIHYVNGTLVGDGELDVSHPEALIYEPVGNRRRLVGVEYIVDSATWLANHDNVPPVLEGQTFLFVDSPNRYNLASFFELHVWAWRDNPNGAFVDWNNDVTCEEQ